MTKTIHIEKKFIVINWLEKGEFIAEVCCAFGLAKGAVRTFQDNAEKNLIVCNIRVCTVFTIALWFT
jgi:hypothetical protein